MIERICNFCYRICWIIAGSFLAIMMFTLATQVFSRYVLNSSLSFAEELIRYLEIWIVFLGASLCVKDNSHPVVSMFTDYFLKENQFFIRLFANMAVFVVGVVMIVIGCQFAMANINQLSPSMRISIAWVYSAIPVSGLFIVIQTMGNIKNLLDNRKNKAKEANY